MGHIIIYSQILFDYSVQLYDMILSSKKSVEDIIIEELAKNPYQIGPDLVLSIQESRPNTTKQAVYHALKFLIKDEVVAKVGEKYFISSIWLQKTHELLQEGASKSNDAIFDLKEKESISYRFPTLLVCDTYWAHLFKILTEWVPAEKPIFVWNPHEWFVVGRIKEEKEIFKVFSEKGKLAYYSIAGETLLDKKFKQQFSTDFLIVNIGNTIFKKENYYLNVFGDFIIEVFIDIKLAKMIDSFYRETEKLEPESIAYFEELIAKKYPVRMKISKNKERANKLCKKLSKDFYIPADKRT